MSTYWWMLCAAILVQTGVVAAEDGRDLRLDPNLAYQAERSDSVTYDVDYSVIVTAPYKTKRLCVWLPLPPSDFGQEVADSSLSTFPQTVKPAIAAEERFGNRFAYFEFSEPQGAQIIRHTFRVKVWELRWELDPEKIVAVERWPSDFERYRRDEEQAIVVDQRFAKLLEEIVPDKGNPLRDLDRVMTWVNDTFEYDHADASLRADATHGLTRRRGHCSDYHSFCAAMGRALGYPTRITYGINPFPKSSPSHCKLEAFLPPYGWVSFDVSETQKLIKEIRRSDRLDAEEKVRLANGAHKRLVRGFRDNTWFVQTRGSDYELAPKGSKRVPVVRTIYAEADGVPLAEPDPASGGETGFAWMTAHKYVADRDVTYPFADWKSLTAK